jgi:arsenite-transporting ATPase
MTDHQTRVTVFAGKGGVGKTTCAAATGLHYSLQGVRTLVISTDATPSLAHIFELKPDARPAIVRENLYFSELGIDEVKQMWDSKFGQDVYQVFSSFVDIGYPEFVDFVAAMLPGLAEEFMVDYIRELVVSGEYQAIVWDTAPLGQTLALLGTPALLVKHLKMAPRIYTQLKSGAGTKESILAIIRRWEALSALNMEFLRTGIDFNLVAIPEALAVNQLDGILAEMDKHGFQVSRLIINNVVNDMDSAFLREKAGQQSIYLTLIQGRYRKLPITELPLLPVEVKGLEGLKKVAEALYK